jgi:hypothetical protein
MPLTAAEKDATINLYSALLGNQEDVSMEIHSLLWELVKVKSMDVESTMWSCLFQRWFAVHAMNGDGTFMSEDSFAQLLAKLKYLVKSTAMVEAYHRQLQHPQGIIG